MGKMTLLLLSRPTKVEISYKTYFPFLQIILGAFPENMFAITMTQNLWESDACDSSIIVSQSGSRREMSFFSH